MTAYTYPGIEPRNPDVQFIADISGVKYDAILSRDKHLSVVTARQACMWLLIYCKGLSQTEAGNILKRDHVTCRHGALIFIRDIKSKAKHVEKYQNIIKTYTDAKHTTAV